MVRTRCTSPSRARASGAIANTWARMPSPPTRRWAKTESGRISTTTCARPLGKPQRPSPFLGVESATTEKTRDQTQDQGARSNAPVSHGDDARSERANEGSIPSTGSETAMSPFFEIMTGRWCDLAPLPIHSARSAHGDVGGARESSPVSHAGSSSEAAPLRTVRKRVRLSQPARTSLSSYCYG